MAKYTTQSEAVLKISRIFSSDGAKKREKLVRNWGFGVSYAKTLIWQSFGQRDVSIINLTFPPPHTHILSGNCGDMKEMILIIKFPPKATYRKRFSLK